MIVAITLEDGIFCVGFTIQSLRLRHFWNYFNRSLFHVKYVPEAEGSLSHIILLCAPVVSSYHNTDLGGTANPITSHRNAWFQRETISIFVQLFLYSQLIYTERTPSLLPLCVTTSPEKERSKVGHSPNQACRLSLKTNGRMSPLSSSHKRPNAHAEE
jgi:hypothetical protein